jgi:hypothetical protein
MPASHDERGHVHRSVSYNQLAASLARLLSPQVRWTFAQLAEYSRTVSLNETAAPSTLCGQTVTVVAESSRLQEPLRRSQDMEVPHSCHQRPAMACTADVLTLDWQSKDTCLWK